MDKLLTVKDVSKNLQVGSSKVYTLVNTGQLSSIRIGKAIRVPAKSLENFVEALEHKSSAGSASSFKKAHLNIGTSKVVDINKLLNF